MLLRIATLCRESSACLNCRTAASSRRLFTQGLDKAYTDDQKEKILEVMNVSNNTDLERYDVTKSRVKKISQWKDTYGTLKTITDIGLIDGFADKYAKKLFDSILKGPGPETNNVKIAKKKIRGQILQPTLSETVRQKCKKILTVYVSVNSICWTLINRENYEVVEWNYHGIDYPDGKKLQITDVMQIAWTVVRRLPQADIYVMKAEATTLRASGSDPNNPKVLAVNLQKSQMISMIVALVNARSNQLDDSRDDSDDDESYREEIFKQKVYFLRPSLPYRLYGTMVGTERVSTDQTVESLLQDIRQRSETMDKCDPYIPEDIASYFRSQNELRRDMLGHCLLLALTFMDLCIYKKQDSVDKLIKNRTID